MRNRTSTHLRNLVALTVGFLTALGGTAVFGQTADLRLSGASSSSHLWFVAPETVGDDSDLAWRLIHHARDMDGPLYRVVASLPREPRAIAAFDDRIWLVFPDHQKNVPPSREVYSTRTVFNEQLGLHLSVPPDLLSPQASLDGHGVLSGFVGHPNGPIALLLPPQWVGTTVDAGSGSAASEPTLTAPRLVQLTGGKWVDIELPEDFSPTPGVPVHLLVCGPDRQALLVLASDADDPSAAAYHHRTAAGEWSTGSLDLSISRVLAAVGHGERPTLLLRDSESQCSLHVIWPGSDAPPKLALALNGFEAPAGRWTIQGLGPGYRLISASSKGSLTIAAVDSLTGDVGKPQAMSKQTPSAGSMFQMPLLVVVAVTGLLLVILFRPREQVEVKLPARHHVCPFGHRLLALMLDMVIPGVLTTLILRVPLVDLFRHPMLSASVDDVLPFLLMAGLTAAHKMVTEMTWGVSVGKAVIGARIVSADGSKLRARSTVLRNIVGWILLVIPVIGVLALVNHFRQTIGDLAARAVIIIEAEEPEAGASDNSK